MNIIRGDIWHSTMSHITGENSLQKGPRPFIPVANGKSCSSSNIITAVIGTAELSKYKPWYGTHFILDESNGLKKPTLFMAEQLQSVPINTIEFKIGRVPDDKIHVLNKCLSVQLELFDNDYVQMLISDIIKVDKLEINGQLTEEDFRMRVRRYKELERYCRDFGYDYEVFLSKYYPGKYYNQRGVMCG